MSIEVRNLTKHYGSAHAVENISFDVKSGEILGFLGPNGAGKTTTMKIITCYIPPTSGNVDVDGYNIYDNSLEVRRKIGYLPELNPLYPDMNVMEFLEFSASLHGMKSSQIKSRIGEMVDVCGLGNVRHKDIYELSKGYKQRVGLAQALIHDPDVLILDEPTSGLDPNQIVEIRNMIKRIGAFKTVILSTHILSEVQATCDRVIIINEGTIVADGSLQHLQEQFRGSESISLEIKHPSADPFQTITPVLRNVNYVDSVEFVKSESDIHSFLLRSAKGVDLRESVFHTVVSNGWTLLEMHRSATSLEELFHKLTQSESEQKSFSEKTNFRKN